MSPDNPKKLNRDKLVTKAYEMRIQSYSYSKIADELGVCRATAFNYVKEGKETYEKFQETNLNHIRNVRVQQLEILIRSRLDDLKNCELDNSAFDSFDEDELDAEKIQLERMYMKDRSFIMESLLKLYQELSKLQGLYDSEKVEKFITKKESNNTYNVSELSDTDLMNIFNEIQESK